MSDQALNEVLQWVMILGTFFGCCLIVLALWITGKTLESIIKTQENQLRILERLIKKPSGGKDE